jgi:type II secretory pathway pseudopilin PulG
MVRETIVRRRARAAGREEDGFSLVELMVVIGLLMLVLGFVMGGLVSFQNESYRAAARLQDLEQARVSMNLVTRDLRTATRMSATTSPFDVGGTGQPAVPAPGSGNGTATPLQAGRTGAGANELWIYANVTLPNVLTPCPDVVHLFVDSSLNLREQVLNASSGAAPSCVYPSTSASYTIRTVGGDVANGTSACSSSSSIFTYYQQSGGTQVAFATSSTPLTPSDAALVDMIGVSLTVRKGTGPKAPCTTLSARVRMPNLGYDTSIGG